MRDQKNSSSQWTFLHIQKISVPFDAQVSNWQRAAGDGEASMPSNDNVQYVQTRSERHNQCIMHIQKLPPRS